MSTNIKELSEKLSQRYGVEAYTSKVISGMGEDFEYTTEVIKTYLAADSGRISDLADDNDIKTTPYPIYTKDKHGVIASKTTLMEKDGDFGIEIIELHKDHPTKSAAAIMARVRCLLAIGVDK